jgi:hypothetical protein
MYLLIRAWEKKMWIGGREKLESALNSHFGNYRQGYFVTLLTDTKMDHYGDSHYSAKKKILDDNISQIGKFIGTFCFGRKYKLGVTDELIRIVSAVEIGGASGRLHCHMVIAHGGGTARTLEDVKKFLSRRWSVMYRTNQADVFVKVDALDLSLDPIHYMTKQTEMLGWLHREDENFLTH